MNFLKNLKELVGTVIYNRGKNYFVEQRCENVKFSTPDDTLFSDGGYMFMGEVAGIYDLYITEVRMNNEELLDCTCTCQYFMNTLRPCKHVVALSILGFENVISKIEVEKDNTDKFLSLFQNQVELKKNLIFLKINPEFEVFREHFSLKLNMSIVSKYKSYKLNNKLSQFLEAYKKRSYNFGKAYTYDPRTDYFQGWENKFLALLEEYISVVNGYLLIDFDMENFLKNGFFFDRLMDILKEGNQIEMENTSLKELLSIEINKMDDGKLKINFSNIDKFYLEGEKTLVSTKNIEKPVFYRLSQEDIIAFKKIYHSTYYNKALIMSEKNLPLIINSAQNMGNLLIEKKLQENTYTPENIEYKLYIDSYGTYGLKIYSKLFYDGKSEDEFKDKIIMSSFLEKNLLYKDILNIYSTNFENNFYHITETESIYNFVLTGIPQLEKEYEIYYSEEFKSKVYTRASYQVKTSVSDLLSINFTINNVDGKEILDFLNAIREKKQYFLLKNGGILSIDSSEGENLNNLLDTCNATKKEIEKGVISRAKNYGYFLNSILQKIKNIQLDETYKEMDRNLKNLCVKKNEKKIKKLFPILRDYQVEGVQWLLTLKELGLGGILGDDMGLGKTLQSIVYLAFEKREKPSIIVAPKSLVYNWKSEFEKFAPNLSVKLCIGTISERESIITSLEKNDILITTYGLMKNDIKFYDKLSYENGFANIFIDEAQNIKNILGKTSNAVKNIKGETKIALTGTPIENNILELWSILDFAFPGYLGKHTTFKEKYSDNLKELKNIVTPFILRRTKKEVLKELPDKIEQDIVIDLTSEQKKVYLAYLKKYKNEIEIENSDSIKILSYITRLRQICNHPKLFLEDYKGESSKIEVLLDILREAKSGGRGVLLFSQFTEMLNIIKSKLKDEFSILYLDGKTKIQDRLTLVEKFNNGEGDVFIISLKAGGSGLNLTRAETVIHFDPWWNPSVENQATDRAHRIGQKNVVNVFKLITKGTIEEKINLIKGEKSKIISEVLDGTKKELLKMSKEELLKLF